MKGFIEITDLYTKTKILVSVDKIYSVNQEKGCTTIVQNFGNKGKELFIVAAESYDEVKEKIKQSEV